MMPDRTARNDCIEQLLEQTYHLIDIFPKQVPKERAQWYFGADEQFQTLEFDRFVEKIERIMLKLSCYYAVKTNCDDRWTAPRTPADFIRQMESVMVSRRGDLQILLPDADTLIHISGGDLYATVYHAGDTVCGLIKSLVESEGLFWRKGQPESE